MINEFFKSIDELKELSLPNRFISEIIAYRANFKFADSVIDILIKRNPEYRKDPNAKSQMEHFLRDRTSAFDACYRIEQMFTATFGELTEELMDEIENIAKQYAEIALKAYKWKGETQCV